MVLLLLSKARSSPPIAIRWVRHIYAGRGFTPQTLRAQGPARTRFAPSPTGYLHLGSLRTALFNYLVAKSTGGEFVLRIEDTDQKRTVPDAERRLYEDLKWAGIEIDEGPNKGGPYGPYKQSERTELYRNHAAHLIESGNAYRCFCTADRLHTLAEHRSRLGLPPDYDRTCAHISKEVSDDRASKGEPHVVRLKVPEKYPIFDDLIYGVVRQRRDPRAENSKQTSFDDPILLKTDGFPTYHLANVVDDHLMQITHVIRGTEWMSSTPKHLAMYDAFGWKPPAFAHVGLLVDENRQKLSKRTGSIDVASFRKEGVFPETLTNFVALLGWSHYEKGDVMAMEDLIRNFSMKFTKGDTIVSSEKLWFLQRRHAARYASLQPPILDDLALQPLLEELNKTTSSDGLTFFATIPEGKPREDYVRSLLMADISNYTLPPGFIKRNLHFFTSPTVDQLRSVPCDFTLYKIPSEINSRIDPTVFLRFGNFDDIKEERWNPANIKSKIEEFVSQMSATSIAELQDQQTSTADPDLAIKKAWKKLVMSYFRWALVCSQPGPDTTETMRILGRKETLARLENAREVIKER